LVFCNMLLSILKGNSLTVLAQQLQDDLGTSVFDGKSSTRVIF